MSELKNTISTEDIREQQSQPRCIGDMKYGLTGSRPQLSILPRTGQLYGSRAIEYGADKYARGNYHAPPPEKLIEKYGRLRAEAYRLLGYIDAAQRHLTHISDAMNRALGTGGDLIVAASVVDDEASGGFPPSMLPHMCHALASLLIGATCAVDGGLLPADPGQPWKTVLGGGGETGLPQKDDPAGERTRVAETAPRLATLHEGGLAADLCPGESDLLAPTTKFALDERVRVLQSGSFWKGQIGRVEDLDEVPNTGYLVVFEPTTTSAGGSCWFDESALESVES